ncbi:hypothetical protein cyc_00105 [Cyclospora cayetanensis]|uniref:Uncharacterized protein n=1 Tax=Cyclospora cayetanensis TaxID=88456 RepID=A0A1D3CYC5_9EIME|nr:hypothetical protein cyc_00105 [Cyclospora cayetanensis]
MRALLKQQQQKHQIADAKGIVLLEQKKRQEEEDQTIALRWQWSKAFRQLRNQESALLNETKQILASHDLFNGDDSSIPLAERAKTTLLTSDSLLTLCNALRTQKWDQLHALLSSSIASHSFRAAECTTDTALSPHRAFGCFAGLQCIYSSLLHLLKQSILTPKGVSADHKITASDAAKKGNDTERLPQNDGSQCAWLQQPWQIARCLLQVLHSVLQREAMLLGQRYTAAEKEASSAIASLRDAQILPQEPEAFLRHPKHCQTQYQGDWQGLSDAEDAVLRGEAPQVRALAKAATVLADIERQMETEAAGRPHAASDDLGALSTLPLAGRDRHLAAISPRGHAGTGLATKGTSVHGSLTCALWTGLLDDYSKRLLQLEGQHAKELQQYRCHVLQYNRALKAAIAALLHSSALKKQKAGKEPMRLWGKLIDQKVGGDSAIPVDPETQIQSVSLPQQCGLYSLATKEGQDEEAYLSFSADSPSIHAIGNLASSGPVESLDYGEGGQKGDEEDNERATNAVAAALTTVRWLWASVKADQGSGKRFTPALMQRLRLAFPQAALDELRVVCGTLQQLSLLQQRQLTCMRVWVEKRQQELHRVLRELDQEVKRQQDAIESSKASLVLWKRRMQLSFQLEEHRKRQAQEERQRAAAQKAAREAMLARENKSKHREQLRRAHEKRRIADFRQRRLLEAQQQNTKVAEEAQGAAAITPEMKLLSAARVARRREQYSLRVLEQQLQQQERQLQEELLHKRLALAADKLKPAIDRDPMRLHWHTASSQSHINAGVQQRQKHQETLQRRLESFRVEHTYSCDTLMQDLRFRLSVALAEKQLTSTKAAQELLSSMSKRNENTGQVLPP